MMTNKKLGEILKNTIVENSEVNIITEKFSLRAFEFLKDSIAIANSFNIIISDNKSFEVDHLEDKRSYTIDKDKTNLLSSEVELKLKNDLLDPYLARCFSEVINKKMFIKSPSSSSKYCSASFTTINNNFTSIISATEYTSEGLGLVDSKKVFIPVEINDQNKFEEFNALFQSFWNDVTYDDVSKVFMEQLQAIYRDHTPEDIYYFNLYHIFNKNLSEYENNATSNLNDWKETKIYQSLYDFQKTAVHGIIEKIEKYNGCILADSVGLGKTYEALAVIKYYELKGMRVLVLTPKKLRENWLSFNTNVQYNPLLDDKFAYDVMNHTDISRTKGKSGDNDLVNYNWSNYDLVVIDESHNFRNKSWTEDLTKNKSRYQQLMEKVIKSGRRTKVLLLTATPVNNKMHDISNQVKFITCDNDSALKDYGIKSIDRICNEAERKANEWADLPVEKRTSKTFEEMIGFKFRNLMDIISIARSRKQIASNYSNNGLVFPKRLAPINIYVNQKSKNNHLENIQQIYNEIKNLTFACYTPLKYIKESKKSDYFDKYDTEEGNFKQTDRETALTKIMMTNWLKRFESSINSFQKTIDKFYQKNKNILEWLNNNSNNDYIEEDFTGDDEFMDEDDDFIEIFSKKIKIKKADLDIAKCKCDIESDLQIFKKIQEEYKDIEPKDDDKLNKLKDAIEEKLNNNINAGNKKVIIFTSYADTANYLYENLSDYFLDRGLYSCVITGSSNKTNNPRIVANDMNALLTYFSPKSKGFDKTNYKQADEIDILIATDCISEGQNLQDCDFLVNYDIHWNPVRIIQRFGRIDRIGSVNNKIQLVNFWPDIRLEEYIKLKNIVTTKMEKVVLASTGDENIIDQSFSNDDNYRVKQLKELQEKVVDIEDLKGDVSFSNLTLSEYTTDLQIYLENNSSKLIKQPTGIFAIANNKVPNNKDGIIFLFKNNIITNEFNPIDPYYLVYVDMHGKVISSYKETNAILNILKAIANNQKVVNETLVDEFNNDTNFGFNMKSYSNLLDIALKSIDNDKEKDAFSKLFNKESTFSNSSNNYELISFLIIKG